MRQSKNLLTSVVVVFSLVVAGPSFALANQTTTESQGSVGERTKSTTKRARSRRSGSKGKTIKNEATVFSATNARIAPDPEPITSSSESDNFELSATLDYIKERMLSYGSQKGYVDSEVIKGSVIFDKCDQPEKPVLEPVKISEKGKGNATSPSQEKPEPPPPAPNCNMTWTVEYTDEPNVKKERKITLTLAHLNLDEVFQSQGVIWIKTAPYKTINVAISGGTVLTEDEWWIDLHDEEVARRVGRALKHAAKVCRGDKYVEKFAK